MGKEKLIKDLYLLSENNSKRHRNGKLWSSAVAFDSALWYEAERSASDCHKHSDNPRSVSACIILHAYGIGGFYVENLGLAKETEKTK